MADLSTRSDPTSLVDLRTGDVRTCGRTVGTADKRWTAALCCALALAAARPAAPAELNSRAFDVLVRQAMSAWEVPGLAVTAVRGDRVVFAKGFGQANTESGSPVTTRTLFAVGSITKPITTTLLAMMADAGELSWDRPLVGYVPQFRLMDREAGRTVTLRDLASHRTGMPRHDVLWYAEAFDRVEMLRRLRHLRPTTPPRQAFQYNNLMYMTAGYAAGRVAGASWERLVRERLFEPLGMTRSKTGFIGFLDARDRAAPYFGAPGGRVPIAPRDTDQVGPAASVYSDVEDLSRFLRFHINGGRIGGRQLLSPDASAELRLPHIDVPRRRRFAEIGDTWYGLGFYVTRYRGRKLVYHPGFIDGYGGLLALFPGERIGVVVLSNLSGHNPVPKIVARMIYDRLLDLEPLPWLERFRAIEQRRNRSFRRTRSKPVPGEGGEDEPAPLPERRPLSTWDVAGTYDHPGYGPIQIWADGSVLSGRFHNRVFPLVRAGVDSWRVAETVWPLRSGLILRFVSGDDDRVDRLATPIADGPTYRYKVGEVMFERREPPSTFANAAALASFPPPDGSIRDPADRAPPRPDETPRPPSQKVR